MCHVYTFLKERVTPQGFKQWEGYSWNFSRRQRSKFISIAATTQFLVFLCTLTPYTTPTVAAAHTIDTQGLTAALLATFDTTGGT